MNIELILFVVLAAVAAISAVVMITRQNPILSALSLIVNFFALSGLYLLLNAQFIAVAQVIVYAGAIMVLFLFVIMLLNTGKEEQILSIKKGLKYFAILLAGVVFAQLAYIIFFKSGNALPVQDAVKSIESGEVQNIGRELYTNYLIPFEAAGFLLLAATMGAMILAKKKSE